MKVSLKINSKNEYAKIYSHRKRACEQQINYRKREKDWVSYLLFLIKSIYSLLNSYISVDNTTDTYDFPQSTKCSSQDTCTLFTLPGLIFRVSLKLIIKTSQKLEVWRILKYDLSELVDWYLLCFCNHSWGHVKAVVVFLTPLWELTLSSDFFLYFFIHKYVLLMLMRIAVCTSSFISSLQEDKMCWAAHLVHIAPTCRHSICLNIFWEDLVSTSGSRCYCSL